MPNYTRLLVCEGYEDVQFFSNLISRNRLPSFRIEDTAAKNDRRGGITKFASKLTVIRNEAPNFFSQLRHVMLVADNDLDPAQNFERVRLQLDKIFPGRTPTCPFQFITGTPTLSIMMLPQKDVCGNLEVLCGEALRENEKGVGTNVDHFLGMNAVTKTWDVCRTGKAWLRSNYAIRADDPCDPIGEIFRDQFDLLDHRHRSLKHIIDFLAATA